MAVFPRNMEASSTDTGTESRTEDIIFLIVLGALGIAGIAFAVNSFVRKIKKKTHK